MMGKIVERMRGREQAKVARQQWVSGFPTAAEMEERARRQLEALGVSSQMSAQQNTAPSDFWILQPEENAIRPAQQQRDGLHNLWGLLR